MLRPAFNDAWPESWKQAYQYDLIEVFGEGSSAPGHARAYDQRMAKTLAMVRAAVDPGARIIDIAAAQGNFSLKLAELGFQVTWNDLCDELAGYVALKHEFGDVQFCPGDVFSLSPAERYDAVLITEIIEHVAHPDQFLAQVARLVRPGGHVVMTTPNGEYFANRLPKFSHHPDPAAFESKQFRPDSDGHIFLLHQDEVAPLAQSAGLEVKSIDLFTSFIAAGRLGTEILRKTLPGAMTRVDQSTARLPDTLARRVHVQMAVCFQKPERALRPVVING